MTKPWEREKVRMHELYMVRNLKLSQMQEIMREQHNFTASERAYKQKFKEWKWFKKTPRGTGISSNPMAINVRRSPATALSYKLVDTHDHMRRYSDSSPELDGMAHQGQMTSPSYADATVSPHHPGYSESQHSLLGLGSVHSPQPIVRASDAYHPISLPPVSELQLLPIKERVKESVRSAQLLLDSENFDGAESYLDHATKTLQWLKAACR